MTTSANALFDAITRQIGRQLDGGKPQPIVIDLSPNGSMHGGYRQRFVTVEFGSATIGTAEHEVAPDEPAAREDAPRTPWPRRQP